jgi:cytochrome c-type biogenesis protein CcmH
MDFWILATLLTVLVAALLVMPLLRKGRQPDETHAGEAAVYRDQLSELERDRASGLISAEEAEYARAEIGRRLIAVSKDKAQQRKVGGRHVLVSAVVVLAVAGTAIYLYGLTGSPGAPDEPLEARMENPGNDVGILIAKAERHLADNPDDGSGWDLLAPIYFRNMRIGDAELAYRNAIRLLGENAERLSGLGETLVAGNDGIVTDEAQQIFQKSVALDGNNPKAKYYLALALEESGKREEALAAFKALAAESPADAPWMPLVNRHIAQVGGAPAIAENDDKAPGNPTAEDVEAAKDMSSGDRQQMIQSMVASLDQKLADDPNNFEGWMRLVRSYAVLNQKDKAEEALKTALKTFPADGDQGRQLVALGKEMGLTVDGASQ